MPGTLKENNRLLFGLLACVFHSVYGVSVIVAGQMARATPGFNFSFRVHMLMLTVIAILIANQQVRSEAGLSFPHLPLSLTSARRR